MIKKPTDIQRRMANHVLRGELTIRLTAKSYAVSPSTVRRAMDRVSEYDHADFDLRISGKELNEIVGWLRNGNTTAKDLADELETRAAHVESAF